MNTQITEKKTKVFKTLYGWEAQTIRTEQGRTFDIHTQKTSSGSIVSTAYECSVNQGDVFTSTLYKSLMNDPFLRVNYGKLRATESTIANCHFDALGQFDIKVNTPDFIESSKAIYKPVKGDILFLDGYGKSKGVAGNFHIIYEVMANETFKTVEKDTLELSIHSHVKDIQNKFGIGMYYQRDFNIESIGLSQDYLANLVIDAVENQKKEDEIDRQQREIDAEIKSQKIQYLSQFTQADRKKTTAILKKYILQTYPEVSKVEIKTEVYSGGDSLNITYFAPAEIEELESFISTFKEGHFNSMEDIYEQTEEREEIIIDNHILQSYKYVFCSFEQTLPNEEKKAVEGLNIDVYSEKAGVVYGNTKEVKDLLKSLGLRFNSRLNIKGETIPGWIFPLSKMEVIKKSVFGF